VGWIILLSAGCMEMLFALSLKYNEGFTRLWPSVATCITGASSFYLLMTALKSVPVGTAYAVWTGMGAVGVAALGIVFLNEPSDWRRLASISLVVAGIAGLKLTDGH